MGSRTPSLPVIGGYVRNDTHRLIPAQYADEPLLGPLAESSADLADLAALAAATNSRQIAQRGRLFGGIGPQELVFGLPFSKIVNAAFANPGLRGGRFNGDRRGAWYAAERQETALAEVAFHRGVALRETGHLFGAMDFQGFRADIRASEGFADLRGDDRFRSCLAPDSYAAGQAFAERLLAAGHAGVVYPSVRDPRSGTNVACLRPALVQNVRLGARFRLTWKGSAHPSVTRVAQAR